MQTPVVTLISTRISPHVSFEEIKEFEAACAKDTRFRLVQGPLTAPMLKCTARFTYAISLGVQQFIRKQCDDLHRAVFTIGFVSPHHAVYKSFPYFTFSCARRCIWVYDAWPDRWNSIENFVKRFSVRLLMLSSLEATNHFRSRAIPGCRVEWLPEAVTIANYRSKPHEQRQTDILQLGRRWDAYHAVIEPYARNQRRIYKYEIKPGRLIFPTHEDLLEGLSDSKISVCVPASITHPSRSAGLETMTWRYLQSMASKCLVLGHAPQEMIELFGYDPVLTIDMEDPARQINYLLSNYEKYIALIEKNYEHVSRYHQWKNRVDSMLDYLNTDSE